MIGYVYYSDTLYHEEYLTVIKASLKSDCALPLSYESKTSKNIMLPKRKFVINIYNKRLNNFNPIIDLILYVNKSLNHFHIIKIDNNIK